MEFSTWIRPRETLETRKEKVFKRLKNYGISNVYVLAFSPFESMGYERYYDEKTLGYDALKFCMEGIIKNKLSGEIWYPVFSNPVVNAREALIIGVEDKRWLCPTSRKARSEILSHIINLLKNYSGFDGIHMDYVRCHSECPEKNGSRFPECKEGFYYVTEFVERLSKLIREQKKTISAAVFIDRQNDGINTNSECYRINQDWSDWVRRNLINRVIPMIYTENNEDFEARVNRSKEIIEFMQTRVELEIGIGVKTDRLSNLNPKQMEKQIEIVKNAGIKRVALFAEHGLSDDHLKVLAKYNR